MANKDHYADLPIQQESFNVRGLFHYRFGPFLLQSEVEIPELPAADFLDGQIVSISTGSVPHELAGSRRFGAVCQVASTEYLLEIAGTARYYAASGTEVRLEIEPGASPANVSLYLLGSVFGALCHQNGFLPLHASAVETGGRVTALLGHSGAGKSTLAACWHARGARIVSDDICLLTPHPDGLRIVPVAGWLKLWRASFEHIGQQPEERNRIASEDDKFRLYLDQAGRDRPRLDRVIFITRAEGPPSLQPLSSSEAIVELMNETYLAYIPELNGARPELFQLCAQVMNTAKAFRLTAPWGWEHMEAVLSLLEA